MAYRPFFEWAVSMHGQVFPKVPKPQDPKPRSWVPLEEWLSTR